MLTNVKIYVPSEVSTEVQEALFSMGNKWRDVGKNIIEEPGEVFLINSRGVMSHGFRIPYYVFRTHPYKEYSYTYLLDMLHLHHDVKLAWANGETFQRKVYDAVNKEKRWIDWEDTKSLDLSRGMDWRVKPKNETIKQWERKYYANGWVTTVAQEHNSEWNPFLRWITEPELVEYTVELD